MEVRRAAAVRDRDHVADLRRALEATAGTTVVADDGPFFEPDLRVSGTDRVVRAAPGFRPVVVLAPPVLASSRNLVAAVDLDDKALVVEGIDFVVHGPDLGPQMGALFRCRNGGRLTLRDCTITVVGPVPHPFAAIQLGEPTAPSAKTPVVRVERTLIRGGCSRPSAFSGRSTPPCPARPSSAAAARRWPSPAAPTSREAWRSSGRSWPPRGRSSSWPAPRGALGRNLH